MRMGSEELKQKVQDIQPKIVCFNGKGICFLEVVS